MNLHSEVQDLRAYAADLIHSLRGHDWGEQCTAIAAAYSEDVTWVQRIIQPIFGRLPL